MKIEDNLEVGAIGADNLNVKSANVQDELLVENINGLALSSFANADTIAVRGADGALKVGMPIEGSDAATKIYVDIHSGSGTYDVVIRTQEDFDVLVSSSTWLGAKSVAIHESIEPYTATTGIVIPDTVKQIQGFGRPKISVTGVGNAIVLGYANKVEDLEYFISNIELSYSSAQNNYGLSNCRSVRDISVVATCTATNQDGGLYGFTNCSELCNCSVKFINQATGLMRSRGFYACDNLQCCVADVQLHRYLNYQATAHGFEKCTNLMSCMAHVWTSSLTADYGGGSGYGYDNCTNVTDCSVIIRLTASGINSSSGFGFYRCINLSGCSADVECVGSGSLNYDVSACGFLYCTYLVNCKALAVGGSTYGTSTNQGSATGFLDCTPMTNCEGIALTPNGTNAYGYNLGSAQNAKWLQISNCRFPRGVRSGYNNMPANVVGINADTVQSVWDRVAIIIGNIVDSTPTSPIIASAGQNSVAVVENNVTTKPFTKSV